MPSGESPLTLEEYAAVHAGQCCGYELGEVLADQGIHASVWEAGEAPWRDALATDFAEDGALGAQYDRCLRKAFTRYARRIEPLESDLEEWLAFFGKWSAHPRQQAILVRVGIQALDVLRLHELWSDRFDEDADLRQRRDALLLQTQPSGAESLSLPEVTTHPATLGAPLTRTPGLTLADAPLPRLEPAEVAEIVPTTDRMNAVSLVAPNPEPPAHLPAPPVPEVPPVVPARSVVPETQANQPHVVEGRPDADPSPEVPTVSVPTFLRQSRVAIRQGAFPPVALKHADLNRTLAPVETKKPALPFCDDKGAPPPIPAAILGATHAGAVPGGPDLPFERKASSAPPPSVDPRSRKPAARSGTMAAVTVPATPATPFDENATVFGLTVRQYASLWVDVADDPSAAAAVFARYQLDIADRQALDDAWDLAMTATPRLRVQWIEACGTYRQWREKQKTGAR